MLLGAALRQEQAVIGSLDHVIFTLFACCVSPHCQRIFDSWPLYYAKHLYFVRGEFVNSVERPWRFHISVLGMKKKNGCDSRLFTPLGTSKRVSNNTYFFGNIQRVSSHSLISWVKQKILRIAPHALYVNIFYWILLMRKKIRILVMFRYSTKAIVGSHRHSSCRHASGETQNHFASLPGALRDFWQSRSSV